MNQGILKRELAVLHLYNNKAAITDESTANAILPFEHT